METKIENREWRVNEVCKITFLNHQHMKSNIHSFTNILVGFCSNIACLGGIKTVCNSGWMVRWIELSIY